MPAVFDRVLLWTGFAAVHAWLAVVGVFLRRSEVFWDVDLYRFWVLTALDLGSWPVLHTDWVYPAGALAPMLLVSPAATSSTAYALGWAVLVTALNAVAVVVLLRSTPHGATGAWWWLASMAALGPVGMGRLEGVIVPLTVSALAIAAQRPRLAAALLTAGAWIKVAPGVMVLALAAGSRRPWRDVALPALAVSGVVVGSALLLGSGARVLGFLSAQSGRGLQVEAVAATPYSLARLGDGAIRAEYSRELNTFEVGGVGTGAVTTALDVALPFAVAVVTWLVWRAARTTRRPPGAWAPVARGPDSTDVGGPVRAVPAPEFLMGALALSLCLVVFNKVGSPQFVSWLLPAVAVALAAFGWARPWRTPAVALLAVAILTQWLFPYAYPDFLMATGPVVFGAALRNLVLVILLGWSVTQLVRIGSPPDAPVTPGRAALGGERRRC